MEALLLLIGLVAAFVFFLPSTIAFSRGDRRRFVILIANVALGWTGIGWLAVLAVSVWPQGDALRVRLAGDPPPTGNGSGDPARPVDGGGPKSPSGDLVSRLAALAELKKAGVLSDAEFARKKQEILSA